MNTPLTLIETSDFEADRIIQENQLIDEALHILDRRLFNRGPKLTSPETVTSYLKLQLTQQEHEVFGVIFFDAQHRVLAFEILFSGLAFSNNLDRGRQRCGDLYPWLWGPDSLVSRLAQSPCLST